MPALNFIRFQGAVPRCQYYTLSEYQGFLYIIPEDLKGARRYDPFADMEALLLDVVRAGGQVAACDSFFEYAIAHDMFPLGTLDSGSMGISLQSIPTRPGPSWTRSWLLWNGTASRPGKCSPWPTPIIRPGTLPGL